MLRSRGSSVKMDQTETPWSLDLLKYCLRTLPSSVPGYYSLIRLGERGRQRPTRKDLTYNCMSCYREGVSVLLLIKYIIVHVENNKSILKYYCTRMSKLSVIMQLKNTFCCCTPGMLTNFAVNSCCHVTKRVVAYERSYLASLICSYCASLFKIG